MKNLKEFLKPTPAKIIISLILFILFVPFINYDTGIRCITTPCDADSNGSIIQYIINSNLSHIYSIHWLILILGIIICCLVSRLIILMYKKFLNK